MPPPQKCSPDSCLKDAMYFIVLGKTLKPPIILLFNNPFDSIKERINYIDI